MLPRLAPAQPEALVTPVPRPANCWRPCIRVGCSRPASRVGEGAGHPYLLDGCWRPDGTLETPPSVHFLLSGLPLGLLGELPPSPAPVTSGSTSTFPLGRSGYYVALRVLDPV